MLAGGSMEPETHTEDEGRRSDDDPLREVLASSEQQQLAEAIGCLREALGPALVDWLTPVAGPFAPELADDVLVRLCIRAVSGQLDPGEPLIEHLRDLADDRLAAYLRRRHGIPGSR